MKHLRWMFVLVAIAALVAPALAFAAEKEPVGLFSKERPGTCAGKDEKPQTSFNDLFGDKVGEVCSGWCTCSLCACSGSDSCCDAGCGACWDYRDSQGYCSAV